MTAELLGYRRQTGRWGFRDHVLVLPLHAALCDLAEEIAAIVAEEVVALRHDWDGPNAHRDADRVRTAFAEFAIHPNVAATLVLGVGPEVGEYVQLLGSVGHPHAVARLDEAGGFRQLRERALRKLQSLVDERVPAEREPAPPSGLCLGLECGASDALSGVTANPALGAATDLLIGAGGTAILAETSELVGAEHLLAQRAVSEAVGVQIIEMVERFERDVERQGVDLRGSQPTPGNIAGGLTTIEEKSLGAARKGGTAPIRGVLEYGQRPTGQGLFVMDTPGQDIEQMVGMVAGGAQIVAFTTGLGTPTGSPIAPCLRIASNSDLARRLPDLIDIDAGPILDGSVTIEAIGEQILDALINAASGASTRAETRGDREFALSRIRP